MFSEFTFTFWSGHSREAVKLLSSLVGVAMSLGASFENSQKLYEVQKTKTKTMRQRSTLQLERIQKKITEVTKVSPQQH